MTVTKRIAREDDNHHRKMGKPNVLLIILDSVRAKNCSLYNYHRDTTPFLNDFASESTVFTQARAPSTASLPSHVSIFTGHHAWEHQLDNNTGRDYELNSGESVWGWLENTHQYSTGLFSTNPYLTGFDVVKNEFSTVSDSHKIRFEDCVDPSDYFGSNSNIIKFIIDSMRTGPAKSFLNGLELYLNERKRLPLWMGSPFFPKFFSEQLIDWIEGNDDPWAACINIMDAHEYPPYRNHNKWTDSSIYDLEAEIGNFRSDFMDGLRSEEELDQWVAAYDGSIHQADKKVEYIIEYLRESGDLEDTLVVITSDHGEAFGEQSNIRSDWQLFGHSMGIHEVQLHVPLLISIPESNEGRTEDSVVSLTYLPETIISIVENENSPINRFKNASPVIASLLPFSDSALNRLNNSYLKNNDEIKTEYLSEPAHAVYENNGDQVRKYAAWGDDEVEIGIKGTEYTVVNNEALHVTKPVVDGLDRLNIAEKVDGKVPTEEIEERLQELGYLEST